MHKVGRPVLVGTTSIEKSEAVSTLLKKRGIPHQVLNASRCTPSARRKSSPRRPPKAVTISQTWRPRHRHPFGWEPKSMAADPARGEAKRDGLEPAAYEKVLAEVKDMQRYGLPGDRRSGKLAAALAKVRKQTEAEHNRVVELGGLHILGTDGTKPAHRQPAPRARGRPGGPRLLPVLSLAGRRPAPPLRPGADRQDHGEAGDGGGGAHRAPLGHPGHETAQKRWRPTTSRSASISWNTRRHEHAAQADIQRAKQLLEGGDVQEVIQGMIRGGVGRDGRRLRERGCYPENWNWPA